MRKNHFKKRSGEKRLNFTGRVALGFKIVSGIVLVIGLSAVYIVTYGVITQCDYLKTKNIEITGTDRLSEEAVLEQANVYPGRNILSVNLSATQKRLLAHPDIANADVGRTFPDGLKIKIEERQPLAIIDFGRRFLLDVNGDIYKEWDETDPDHLPIVRGLQFSDIGVMSKYADTPFTAVMNVLQVGRNPKSILPNALIKRIQVDREIGLTLYTHDRIKAIKLGYGDYPDKYIRLKDVTRYLMKRYHVTGFNSIDLIDTNRIVVNPVDVKPILNRGKEV